MHDSGVTWLQLHAQYISWTYFVEEIERKNIGKIKQE